MFTEPRIFNNICKLKKFMSVFESHQDSCKVIIEMGFVAFAEPRTILTDQIYNYRTQNSELYLT